MAETRPRGRHALIPRQRTRFRIGLRVEAGAEPVRKPLPIMFGHRFPEDGFGCHLGKALRLKNQGEAYTVEAAMTSVRPAAIAACAAASRATGTRYGLQET